MTEMYSSFKEVLDARSAEDRRSLAHIKRFLERWSGDPAYRESILAGELDLTAAARDCGSQIDLWSLQPVFHPDFVAYRAGATADDWPLAKIWDEYFFDMIRTRSRLLLGGDSKGLTPAYDKWRIRQMTRVQLELGAAAAGIVHAPISFELSVGCSVGCWFCGISAADFGGNYSLTGDGADQWRETLIHARNILGSGLASGFLYWGTEPLDNPEYPEFLRIFFEVTGVVPQTTTAVPLRNPELTREVLGLSEENWHVPNRFSVLTTAILKRIHAAFTPEELLSVEMVLQMDGSTNLKSNTGRAAREAEGAIDGKAAKRKAQLNLEQPATIACVSGFLVNIVQKRVRLVSPCAPSRENPDGYLTIESRRYEDPADMEKSMREMITQHMDRRLQSARPVTFAPSYSYEKREDRHLLVTPAIGMEAPVFESIGPALSGGSEQAVDLAVSAVRHGNDPIAVVAFLEQLHESGIISEAPAR